MLDQRPNPILDPRPYRVGEFIQVLCRDCGGRLFRLVAKSVDGFWWSMHPKDVAAGRRVAMSSEVFPTGPETRAAKWHVDCFRCEPPRLDIQIRTDKAGSALHDGVDILI